MVGDKIQSDKRKFKIYHGPDNIGGAGGYCAEWLRKKGHQSDFITYVDHTRRQNHDFNLGLDRYNFWGKGMQAIAFFLLSLTRYQIFHFYNARTLLPGSLDLPFLRLLGKKLVMQYCGTDIRTAEVERKRHPYWDIAEKHLLDPKKDIHRKMRMWWQGFWCQKIIVVRDGYDAAKICIPENKLVEMPLHNTMDMKVYKPERYETRDVPVIVHAPSNKEVKGTRYIEAAIEELKKDGFQFEYRRIEMVPNDEAQRIYKEEADIIIDQILLGAPGSLVMEAMYYGKPVLCYIIDEIKKEHCPDIPIVNSHVDNIKEQIQWLIENPKERTRLGKEGREFVESYVDRDMIMGKLENLYNTI